MRRQHRPQVRDPLAELLASLIDPVSGKQVYPGGKFPREPEWYQEDHRRWSR